MDLLSRAFPWQANVRGGEMELAPAALTSVSQVKDNRARSKSEVGDIGTNPDPLNEGEIMKIRT